MTAPVPEPPNPSGAIPAAMGLPDAEEKLIATMSILLPQEVRSAVFTAAVAGLPDDSWECVMWGGFKDSVDAGPLHFKILYRQRTP